MTTSTSLTYALRRPPFALRFSKPGVSGPSQAAPSRQLPFRRIRPSTRLRADRSSPSPCVRITPGPWAWYMGIPSRKSCQVCVTLPSVK